MGEPLGLTVASLGANFAGAKIGQSLMGGGGQDKILEEFNHKLNVALDRAISDSTYYTDQAKKELRDSLGIARQDITGSQAGAAKQMLGLTNQGFNLGQGLLTPYRNLGYNAADQYAASLGMATPAGGSANQANQAALQQQMGLLNQQFGGQAPTAPKAPTLDPSKVTAKQINDYLAPLVQNVGRGKQATINGKTFGGSEMSAWNAALPELSKEIQNVLAQQNLGQAQQEYNAQLDLYNQQQADYDQQAEQLQQLYPTQDVSGTGGTAQPQQSGLQQFLNSPAYQLLYGSGAGDTLSSTGEYNPVDAFQQDPGYQYAIDQAMKNVNQQAASRGLLESGALQKELLRTSQGMQNQQYQNYLNQQASLFGNYQGNLAGLTNMGSDLTGAATAANLYGQAGSQLGNQQFQLGGLLANAGLGVASDLASLNANQGVFQANAVLNTGAAQANAFMNQANQQQQIAANNQANSALLNQNVGGVSQRPSNFGGQYGTYGQVAPNGNQTYYGNPWGSFQQGGLF